MTTIEESNQSSAGEAAIAERTAKSDHNIDASAATGDRSIIGKKATGSDG
ncbi:hypothetical protein [Streptomyces sp. NPDC002599]